MSINLSVHVLELLASKLCHDLISPIGAINNGVELLEEMGADAAGDVSNLIAFSAGQASSKLQAYRLAYGAGGADSSIKPEDVYNTFEAMIKAESKVTQEWDPHGAITTDEKPAGFNKILICALLMALDTLPKGGKISVEPGDKNAVAVLAEGEDANFKESSDYAFTDSLDEDDLTPRNIHAHVFSILAKNYGFSIETGKSEPGRIVIEIMIH